MYREDIEVDKTFRSLFGQIIVAFTDARAANVQFADNSGRQFVSVAVDNEFRDI